MEVMVKSGSQLGSLETEEERTKNLTLEDSQGEGTAQKDGLCISWRFIAWLPKMILSGEERDVRLREATGHQRWNRRATGQGYVLPPSIPLSFTSLGSLPEPQPPNPSTWISIPSNSEIIPLYGNRLWNSPPSKSTTACLCCLPLYT